MQAIARANRRFPGKDFGLIVDYNGMLASLRAALAQYDSATMEGGGEDIIAPIEERVQGPTGGHRGDRGAFARPRL
jgi:type I restriction enzyme, R subunit